MKFREGDNNIKYYEVLCKGGHVGRSRFMPMTRYVHAESGKAAVRYARYLPMINHDHKDCILAVQEISREEFLDGLQRNAESPYMNALNVQEQRAAGGIYERTVKEHKVEYKEKHVFVN